MHRGFEGPNFVYSYIRYSSGTRSHVDARHSEKKYCISLPDFRQRQVQAPFATRARRQTPAAIRLHTFRESGLWPLQAFAGLCSAFACLCAGKLFATISAWKAVGPVPVHLAANRVASGGGRAPTSKRAACCMTTKAVLHVLRLILSLTCEPAQCDALCSLTIPR